MIPHAMKNTGKYKTLAVGAGSRCDSNSRCHFADSSPILARVDHGYDDRHPHDTSRPHYDTDHDSLEAQYPGRQQKEQYGSSHKPIQEPAVSILLKPLSLI